MRDRALNYAALVLSAVSLAYAGWMHHNAEQMATAVLRQREAQLVRQWAPVVRTMSLDMLGTNAVPKEPRTLEDLSRPFFMVLDQLGRDSMNTQTNTMEPPNKRAAGDGGIRSRSDVERLRPAAPEH